MPWTPDVAYLTGLDFFDEIVRSVGAVGWNRPSPCTNWMAVDVLGHVGIAVEFGTKLLRDERPEWQQIEPPGEAVSDDPAQWWAAKVETAKDAVHGVDLAKEVDSPLGRRSIGQGLSFPAVDLFVHGWDLARSVGRDFEISDEAIAFAHAVIDPVPTEQVRSPRVFAAEVTAPDDATATQIFIAWTGRNPFWTSTTVL